MGGMGGGRHGRPRLVVVVVVVVVAVVVVVVVRDSDGESEEENIAIPSRRGSGIAMMVSSSDSPSLVWGARRARTPTGVHVVFESRPAVTTTRRLHQEKAPDPNCRSQDLEKKMGVEVDLGDRGGGSRR